MMHDICHLIIGQPLSGDAWVKVLEEDVESVLVSEKAAYLDGISKGPKITPGSPVDLDMRVLLVHGDDVIADSNDGGLTNACAVYKQWLDTLEI